MDREQFWRLVETTRPAGGADCCAHAKRLVAALCALPATEIVAFDHRYQELLDAAYRWDVWGAAHLINGGCSDDDFLCFLTWLLGQGRETYEATLRDPDTLADHPQVRARWGLDPPLSCEDMLYVAYDAYVATGDEALPNEAAGSEAGPLATGPIGVAFDFDDADAMRRRYPRLWERVGRDRQR